MIMNRQKAKTHIAYDRNGNVTEFTYADGGKVTYTYDRAGRLRTSTAQNGLVTELTYDGNENIIRIKDDDSRIYKYDYDHNNLWSRGGPIRRNHCLYL